MVGGPLVVVDGGEVLVVPCVEGPDVQDISNLSFFDSISKDLKNACILDFLTRLHVEL